MSRLVAALLACLLSLRLAAGETAAVETALPQLADRATREAALSALTDAGDARALPALEALAAGMFALRDGRPIRYEKREIAVDGATKTVYTVLDALTGAAIAGADGKPASEESLKDAVPVRNADRRAIRAVIGVLELRHVDPVRRREAIIGVGDRAETDVLPALRAQLDAEPDGPFAGVLRESIARIHLKTASGDGLLAAIGLLGEWRASRALPALQERLKAETAKPDADAALAAALTAAIERIESRQAWTRRAGHVFNGLSLGSILILLALGLSIVFGLMGVINMAHGELMMVGAFTTWGVANFFQAYLPGWFDWYLIAAIPAAFLAAALTGWVMEVTVIRRLYGRPLETLLATWGISLILIQTARVCFGDLLSVTPPRWMNGGWALTDDFVLPYNRLFIIAFTTACVIGVWLLINRSKLGLLLRATTQNRQMAACLGVPTRRIDALTFALGSGLAGLAGVAVPLFDKINPNMGQGYIVESFLVVVTGGVGKLAGTVWAGLGLGWTTKLIEPFLESVFAKVAVLGLVIVFLQWRPSGLFPAKGRHADSDGAAPAYLPERAVAPRVRRLRFACTLSVLAVGFVIVPALVALGVIDPNNLNRLGRYLSYALVALGIDLIWGYTGMLSLAQALFFCLGAYGMAMHLSLPQGGGDVRPEYHDIPQFFFFNEVNVLPAFWQPFASRPLAIALALLVPALLAALFGWFIFRSRVKGVYFSIITQALAWAAFLSFSNNKMLVGGTNGLTNFSKALNTYDPAKPDLRWIYGLYFCTAVVLALSYLLCRHLVASRAGRVLVAVRDNESRLRFSGFQPVAYKVFAFTVAGVLAALGGMLYVPQTGIVAPFDMRIEWHILMVIWVAVGGRGRLWGAIFGALLVNYAYAMLTSDLPAAWPFIQGAMFLAVVLFFPDGFVRLWDRVEARFAARDGALWAALPVALPMAFVLIDGLGLMPAALNRPLGAGAWAIKLKYLVFLAALAAALLADHLWTRRRRRRDDDGAGTGRIAARTPAPGAARDPAPLTIGAAP